MSAAYAVEHPTCAYTPPMSSHTASEAEALDETKIAADAARMAAALTALTERRVDVRVEAQERFDTVGLPRGLMPLDAL